MSLTLKISENVVTESVGITRRRGFSRTFLAEEGGKQASAKTAISDKSHKIIYFQLFCRQLSGPASGCSPCRERNFIQYQFVFDFVFSFCVFSSRRSPFFLYFGEKPESCRIMNHNHMVNADSFPYVSFCTTMLLSFMFIFIPTLRIQSEPESFLIVAPYRELDISFRCWVCDTFRTKNVSLRVVISG